MNLRQHLHWLCYPLFLMSCARVTAPTGGPKDTIPPILLRAIPTNGQTNYQAKTLELSFNEMLLLNNPKEQIIIIPDVGKDFDIQTKKNKVFLTLKNPLEENTTYAVNFRESVQDITEKNPVENLKIAFSTGPYIDSLSISGNVFHLLKGQPVQDATVALYQADTFNIFQHKPSYFSKTDKEGDFEIANLKPGHYRIYAFVDKNKNLIVESKSEPYGFLPNTLPLTQNQQDIDIPLIRLDTRPLKLTSARPSGTYFNIKTTKEILHYHITSSDSTPLATAYGEDRANIRIYNTLRQNQDSLLIFFTAQDSIYQTIDTTFYLKFSSRQASPEKFQVQNQGFRVLGPKGTLSGQLAFNKPLHRINFDSILYQIDSATQIFITPQDIHYDTITNILQISKQLDRALLLKQQNPNATRITAAAAKTSTTKRHVNANAPYQLYVAPKTFISIELDSSTYIRETLQPTTLETTGIITVQYDPDIPHIIQILTKEFKLVQQSINQKLASFEDLPPATYLLRIILDDNQDGQWSPGNYFTNTPPELIIYYKNPKDETSINLKANWEIGPLLITP